jgi:hypothetical protein
VDRQLLNSLALSLTAAAALVAGAAGASAAETRGSALANPANTTFGCEALVDQDVDMGTWILTPGTTPDCTWWARLPLDASIDGPTSPAVPGSGFVTKVRIKSGPNPAPLRVAIMRSVDGLTPEASETAPGCCAGVAESEEFTPLPNAISEVQVNLPVVRSEDPAAGTRTYDIVGVTADANTGSLPIFDAGPETHGLVLPGEEAPLAAMIAPSVEPGEAPRDDTRLAVGWEVLVQYDFIPGDPTQPLPVTAGGIDVVRSQAAGSSRRRRGVVRSGTRRRDKLTGTPLRDVLRGKAGNDVLRGLGGNDRLVGGPGNDRLVGGRGNDVISAVDGKRDAVRCGKGRDRARVDWIDAVFQCEKVIRVPKRR